MSVIRAIYENGVFTPLEPVDLPERSEVKFEPQLVLISQKPIAMEGVYSVLSKRFTSGESDVAERHNEHQP